MKKIFVLFIFPVFIFSCGIPEYFYLEQVPQGQSENNTVATISVFSFSPEHYYARGYRIYYRIYIGNNDSDIPSIETNEQMRLINENLYLDYRYFYPFTDPTNYTSILGRTTFSGRNYYILELEEDLLADFLASSNISSRLDLSFLFPPGTGQYPVLTIKSDNFHLKRSGDLNLDTDTDPSFRITNELFANTYADVAAGAANSSYVYVSMYIVAYGIDRTFGEIFSKPTHINIFRLPDKY